MINQEHSNGAVSALAVELSGTNEADEGYESRMKGTHEIISISYPVEGWETFKLKPLKDTLLPILPKLHHATVIVLCRRHLELLPYFLNFFHTSPVYRAKPAYHIPFLYTIARYIPLQWIALHIPILEDMRYAYQLCKCVFDSIPKILPRPFQYLRHIDNVWSTYLEISGVKCDMTRPQAYSRIIEYKWAIKNISECKLKCSLATYVSEDKKIMIENMISGQPSPTRLSMVLKSQILPLCQLLSIDVQPILIKHLSKVDWDMAARLKLVREFIHSSSSRTLVLSTFQYKNDQDLELLRAFSREFSLPFLPKFENLTKPSLKPSQSTEKCDMIRSSTLPARRAVGMKRSPSIDMSKVSHNIVPTVASIADGYPTDPVLYAEKLKPLRNNSEVRPIYELAEDFQIVVSHSEFSDPAKKIYIVSHLIETRGYQSIDLVFKATGIDPDTLILSVLSNDKLLEEGIQISGKCLKYISRRNCRDIKEFVDRSVMSAPNGTTASSVVSLYLSLFSKILDVASADDALQVFTDYESLSSFYEDSRFTHTDTLSEEYKTELLFSEDDSEHTKDDIFYNAFSSDNVKLVASAVKTLRTQTADETRRILTFTIDKLPGTRHSRLELAYRLMPETDEKVHLFQYLTTSHLRRIDFHSLIANPKHTLLEFSSLDAVTPLTSLAESLDVNSDTIILACIARSNSSSHRDFLDAFKKLKSITSITGAVKHLSIRLAPSEVLSLLQYIGRTDLLPYSQTVRDFASFSLNDVMQDDASMDCFQIIKRMFSHHQVNERLGTRLHDMAEGICQRFGTQFINIREKVLLTFLTEDCDDEEAVNRIISLLGANGDWAFETLTNILEQGTIREKERAFASIMWSFSIDLENFTKYEQALFEGFIEISSGSRPFYRFAYSDGEQSDGKPKVMRVHSLAYLQKHGNPNPLFSAALKPYNDILRTGKRYNRTTPSFVISDALTALSNLPIDFHKQATRETIETLISKLIQSRNSSLAAELAIHVPSHDIYSFALEKLLEANNYDECLSWGFDESIIFEKIILTGLSSAIETLTDAHFTKFAVWLKKNSRDHELFDIVVLLSEQGRTVEARKVENLLHSQSPM